MASSRNQTPKVIPHLGLDVHKETIAVSIAPQNSTEDRRYGIIGGTLAAVDKLLKKPAADNIELRRVHEAQSKLARLGLRAGDTTSQTRLPTTATIPYCPGNRERK